MLMTETFPGSASVTLNNCDQEPIHIPGHIQPHGASLIFDRNGTLIGWSANVSQFLQFQPAFGLHLNELNLDEKLWQTLQTLIANIDEEDSAPLMQETIIRGRELDFIAHTYNGRIIAEFELRDQAVKDVATFALNAHRAIDRLKRQKSSTTLLQMAVKQVREITGFDRVMAYRFRHDDSGDI